ncbi:MAG TPA: hypothetical protein VGV07_22430 [Devosia sp.]|uniref:hypothetical protein n=1 Tax=Devosia sp. TaxID=1871048 RepID=UPI002DDC8FEC|nr:hypothetical protein [Devosia sp.]HEV2518025.1 hypothetical protein [Devosia sp.]
MTEPLKAAIELDQKAVLRGLLDVAKVAIGPDMPELPDEEAAELLLRLLAIVDRAMPPDLAEKDIRVISARLLADKLKQ